MLTLSNCSSIELSNAFDTGRFRLHLGSLVLKVSSNIPEFIAIFRQLYGDHPVSLGGGEYDFDLAIRPPSLWRRWFRRSATFEFCGVNTHGQRTSIASAMHSAERTGAPYHNRGIWSVCSTEHRPWPQNFRFDTLLLTHETGGLRRRLDDRTM